MSRVVIVIPLAPLVEGDSFLVAHWPLHITVVPPFSTSANTELLATVITHVTARHPPITVVAGDERLFGRNHTIPVTLVNDHPGLTELHRDLVAAVRPLAADPDERLFTATEFSPHVTVKNGRRVIAGDVLTLAQVALVDMAARADPSGRSVLSTSPLNHGLNDEWPR
jgi:2'-5' RNA ligase